jgi:hypothetical protein
MTDVVMIHVDWAIKVFCKIILKIACLVSEKSADELQILPRWQPSLEFIRVFNVRFIRKASPQKCGKNSSLH